MSKIWKKLKPLLGQTIERFSDVNDFDSFFLKLKLAERNTEKDKELVKTLNQLQNKANILDKINSELKKQLDIKSDDVSILSEIENLLKCHKNLARIYLMMKIMIHHILQSYKK